MTDRRDFLVKFTMAAGAVSVLRPFNVFARVSTKFPVFASTNVLTILHTANIKGQRLALGSGEKMAGFGGLQSVLQKIAAVKKETSSLLVIDAGNMTDPSQTNEERLNFYKTATHAGYDIIVPGRTDLAAGADTLMGSVNASNLHVISSVYPFAIDSAALPCSVVRKGKTNIGIINAGLTAAKGVQKNAILRASVGLNQTAQMLRTSKRCTLIICVVQSSEQKCAMLAGLSAGIDVLISTADKTSLHNTQIVRNQSNHEVIISYAGAKGAMMSRIDLTYNDKGEKINVASKAIFTGAKEEGLASILKKYAVYNT